MNTKIRVEHIRDQTGIEALRDAWNVLLRQSPLQSTFLTWEWSSTWWKHYNSGKELWLLAAWDGNELVGLAPFMRIIKRKNGVGFRVIKPLSATDCDVSAFIVRDGSTLITSLFCDYLLSQRNAWDVIQLSEYRLDDPQTRLITNRFTQAGFQIYLTKSRHFYIPISGDWTAYSNQLSKKFKSDIKRRSLRADELGKISLRQVKGREVNREHFQIVFQINEDGHFADMYKSAQDQDFHRELMEQMRERGWVTIYFLYIDETPLAFRYGFTYDDRFEDWRTGFNQLHPQLASGKLLMQKVLETQFTLGYKEFDFLRGTDEYKTRWHPLAREYADIRIASIKRPAAWLAFVGFSLFRDWYQEKWSKKQEGNSVPEED